MRFVLVALAIACSSSPITPTPTATAAPAPVTKLGYFGYNGRCPGFGITFAEKQGQDPLSPDRICVLFPALEKLTMPDDAKREAFRAMTDKHVKVTYTGPDAAATISVTAVELAN